MRRKVHEKDKPSGSRRGRSTSLRFWVESWKVRHSLPYRSDAGKVLRGETGGHGLDPDLRTCLGKGLDQLNSIAFSGGFAGFRAVPEPRPWPGGRCPSS